MTLTHDIQSERARIVQTARSLDGIPYRNHGRLADGTLDCLGVLLAVAELHGYQYVDDRSYSALSPDGYYLIQTLSAHMDVLDDWHNAEPGDLLVQRWHITKPPQHCGIITTITPNHVRLVHASRRERRVVENIWAERHTITHAFRLRELTALMNLAGGHTNG